MEADYAELQSAIKLIEPFDIHFVGVGSFENGTIYLETGENQQLKALMERVVNAFPDTPPYQGEFSNPKPHLTVAKAENDPVKFSRLLTEFTIATKSCLPYVYRATAIAVMEEREDHSWHTTRTLPLSSNS